MADTIKHACGHTHDYAFGNDREWWLAFVPKTICPKCFAKTLRKKKAKGSGIK